VVSEETINRSILSHPLFPSSAVTNTEDIQKRKMKMNEKTEKKKKKKKKEEKL